MAGALPPAVPRNSGQAPLHGPLGRGRDPSTPSESSLLTGSMIRASTVGDLVKTHYLAAAQTVWVSTFTTACQARSVAHTDGNARHPGA
jgi:hypothetical protein